MGLSEWTMKRYKNLYPQITSFENLYAAYWAAARGKRSRSDVAAFEYDEKGQGLPPALQYLEGC